MKIKTALSVAAVAIAFSIPAAVAQMHGIDMQKMMQMMMPASNDPDSTKDYKQSHMDMMKSMNMEFYG